MYKPAQSHICQLARYLTHRRLSSKTQRQGTKTDKWDIWPRYVKENTWSCSTDLKHILIKSYSVNSAYWNWRNSSAVRRCNVVHLYVKTPTHPITWFSEAARWLPLQMDSFPRPRSRSWFILCRCVWFCSEENLFVEFKTSSFLDCTLPFSGYVYPECCIICLRQYNKKSREENNIAACCSVWQYTEWECFALFLEKWHCLILKQE